MSRIIEVITGRRSWVVAVVGLLLGLVVIGGLGQAERSPSPLDTLPAGFESTQGQELLDRLPDEAARPPSSSSPSRTTASSTCCRTSPR